MTPSLLLAVLASGFIYGITPGPGVLAVFGIGAARGRRAGAGFLCGHLLGDVIWCSTALIAIVGAREFGSTAFNVLGLISGLYLFWLGLRAVRAQRGPARAGAAAICSWNFLRPDQSQGVPRSRRDVHGAAVQPCRTADLGDAALVDRFELCGRGAGLRDFGGYCRRRACQGTLSAS